MEKNGTLLLGAEFLHVNESFVHIEMDFLFIIVNPLNSRSHKKAQKLNLEILLKGGNLKSSDKISKAD